jgi:hypothetical protein
MLSDSFHPPTAGGRKNLEQTMSRMGLLAGALAASALMSVSLRAQGAADAPGETDNSRFSLSRTEDGYLRLDGATGQVSICTRRQSHWLCEIVPDERTALEAEMARLQRDNAALKNELLARHVPLPPAPAADAPPRAPDNQELARIKGVIETVWRRLVALIVSVQRDLRKPS